MAKGRGIHPPSAVLVEHSSVRVSLKAHLFDGEGRGIHPLSVVLVEHTALRVPLKAHLLDTAGQGDSSTVSGSSRTFVSAGTTECSFA
ncbi:hypothetical protein [Hydromonas duriensis]|uniref:hypothetical protein n=1 Tax=Hydromonas duriensis TaxID=1527608 RepID=UPI0010610007|nr:hypothetical protein [Hydromonas duriensis]